MLEKLRLQVRCCAALVGVVGGGCWGSCACRWLQRLAGCHACCSCLHAAAAAQLRADPLPLPCPRSRAHPQAQLNGRELGWAPLNRLCWAIGSISGSMVEEQENRCGGGGWGREAAARGGLLVRWQGLWLARQAPTPRATSPCAAHPPPRHPVAPASPQLPGDRHPGPAEPVRGDAGQGQQGGHREQHHVRPLWGAGGSVQGFASAVACPLRAVPPWRAHSPFTPHTCPLLPQVRGGAVPPLPAQPLEVPEDGA